MIPRPFFPFLRTHADVLRTHADLRGLMRIVSRNIGTLYQNTWVLPQQNAYSDRIGVLLFCSKTVDT